MRLRVLAVSVMPVLLMAQYRLVTIDPGHFHAALIQKEASADLNQAVDIQNRGAIHHVAAELNRRPVLVLFVRERDILHADVGLQGGGG